MKREGTIGAAAFLVIAAVVGYSVQTGPKPAESSGADRSTTSKRSKPSIAKHDTRKVKSGCTGLEEELEDFLAVKDLILPGQCYESGVAPPIEDKEKEALGKKTSQLKFVIALMPDPVHTHSSALFDQFAVSIQEGAQDEKYDFASAWLPWDDEASSYVLFDDEKKSNKEKEFKEDQPGIILFRTGEELANSYSQGLIVFVVGEEATHGIHKEQFYNALEWIAALHTKPDTDPPRKRLAILGPTFSGSFSSLAQVLMDPDITEQLDLGPAQKDRPLAIYSGSVSSFRAAKDFQNKFDPQVVFHSFVQNDDEVLARFCRYIRTEQPGFDASKVAIISEDETAYGGSGLDGKQDQKKEGQKKQEENICSDKALKLYYPRDISALRGAYQTKSLFDAGTSSPGMDPQRRNLPTDLADPMGKVHDSIPTYGGNQTPLAQEAFLLEMVAALRELHARYIILRSSNIIDQLFLTNFLRRSYPDGRIVIMGSDLMFIRERGATGLSGSMTLSTYPLFPLERDWTEHQSLPAADRVFSSDTAEGTYVALRLLLNGKRINGGTPLPHRCSVLDENQAKDKHKEKDKGGDADTIFLPPASCTDDPPIPDYSPPFWTLQNQCGERKDNTANESCPYPGPATWLSVIGVNRFWPMASLTKETPHAPFVDYWTKVPAKYHAENRETDPGGQPETPLGMKVFWFVLAVFSAFHAWCCWSGSYTAKPAFLAHFASTGDWRHLLLAFGGSCCVDFLAVLAAWGSGVFSIPAAGLPFVWFAFFGLTIVLLTSGAAVFGNGYTARELSKNLPIQPDLTRMTNKKFKIWMFVGSALFIFALALFYRYTVHPLERMLLPENRVLTYWRAMHLTSGVSPLVPFVSILAGLYLTFWFALHGLALFGLDCPCLPPKERLQLKDAAGELKDYLRMFSQEDGAEDIEDAARPLNWKTSVVGSILFLLILAVVFLIGRGVPVRSLGAERYASIFLVGLNLCCTLSIVVAWRFAGTWEELKRLLTFLDRLPLRRTLAVLHGFSWGSVWKMSGNVLEVRYKVISRQMECMNHSIASLQKFLEKPSDVCGVEGTLRSLSALASMRTAGKDFADWYSINYKESRAGDLTKFRDFQKSIASASGTLFAGLLVPAWRQETGSLLAVPLKEAKEEPTPTPPPQSEEEHIRNAEEFVCLNYLGFIQNVVGRLRTMALTILALFLTSTVAMSSYPFDPRQALSAILIVLFVITGAVIVKVYAEMHRDATLSHVTNTKPGELGAEFWFKIIGFGFAPLLGLLTRIFPGISDFVFSWLQPSISSFK